MLNAQEFLRQAVVESAQEGAVRPSHPQVVYVPTPQGSRNGFLKTLVQVALVGAVVFGGFQLGKGNISISPVGQQAVQVATVQPVNRPMPTSAYIAVPTVAAPVVAAPDMVQVIPQGKPRIAQPEATVVLPPPIVTPLAGGAIWAAPTPGVYGTDVSCNSSNATWHVEPKRVIEPKTKLPIGVVEAFSCTSEADAVKEAQVREVAMVEAYEAAHK